MTKRRAFQVEFVQSPEAGAYLAYLRDSKEAKAELRERMEGSEERSLGR